MTYETDTTSEFAYASGGLKLSRKDQLGEELQHELNLCLRQRAMIGRNNKKAWEYVKQHLEREDARRKVQAEIRTREARP